MSVAESIGQGVPGRMGGVDLPDWRRDLLEAHETGGNAVRAAELPPLRLVPAVTVDVDAFERAVRDLEAKGRGYVYLAMRRRVRLLSAFDFEDLWCDMLGELWLAYEAGRVDLSGGCLNFCVLIMWRLHKQKIRGEQRRRKRERQAGEGWWLERSEAQHESRVRERRELTAELERKATVAALERALREIKSNSFQALKACVSGSSTQVAKHKLQAARRELRRVMLLCGKPIRGALPAERLNGRRVVPRVMGAACVLPGVSITGGAQR